MKDKKETKPKAAKKAVTNGEAKISGDITNESDLKSYLTQLRDKMAEDQAPAIYAVSSINLVLTDPEVFCFLNAENKELARDIWLRIKQAGFQAKNPPMLFGVPDSTTIIAE